jgi:hypothetical protein
MASGFNAGVFALLAAIIACAKNSLRHIHPSRTASSNASFAVSRKSASGNITSAISPKPVRLLLSESNGTTPTGRTKPSAIAARDSFARYQLRDTTRQAASTLHWINLSKSLLL